MSVAAFATAAAEVQHQQVAWGETQRVAVVVSSIDLGAAVADAVEWQDHPVATVAKSAVPTLGADHVARFPMVAGQVVLEHSVMVGGAALAENLPPGTAALALPTGAGWPELSVGDRVDLVATFPVGDTLAGAESTQRVASGAVVVDLGDRLVTIAVPEGQVTTVAHALARAVILAVLVPIS